MTVWSTVDGRTMKDTVRKVMRRLGSGH